MIKKWVFILSEKQSISVMVSGEQDNLRFHESVKKPQELLFIPGESRSAYVNLLQIQSIVIEDVIEETPKELQETQASDPVPPQEAPPCVQNNEHQDSCSVNQNSVGPA